MTADQIQLLAEGYAELASEAKPLGAEFWCLDVERGVRAEPYQRSRHQARNSAGGTTWIPCRWAAGK